LADTKGDLLKSQNFFHDPEVMMQTSPRKKWKEGIAIIQNSRYWWRPKGREPPYSSAMNEEILPIKNLEF
jgi:hypothetical protein